MVAKFVRYNNEGEWAALYENGKLVKVGDHYLVDEYLISKLDIEDREGDFTCGTDRREGVPDTLQELEDFIQEAEDAAIGQELSLLDAQIEELQKKKEELRKGNMS